MEATNMQLSKKEGCHLKTNINIHIDYVMEAIELLFRYANKEDFHKLKQSLMNKYSLNNCVIDKLDKVILISDSVYKKMNIDEETLNFFFKRINSASLCLGKIILLMHPDITSENLMDRINKIRSLDMEEIYIRVGTILREHDMLESDNAKEIESLEDLIKVIDQMEISNQEKWNLTKVFLHYEKYLDELASIIKEIIIYLDACSDKITELINQFKESWERYLLTNEIDTYLDNQLNINLGHEVDMVYMIPSIMACNSISLTMATDMINTSNKQKVLYMYTGILFDDSFDTSKKQMNAVSISNQLKLLGDKNKLEILLKIKDNKAYGQELAEYLGLTTATISHHMSTLMDAGFVFIEKENNRVYYSLNKDKIDEVLQLAKQALID
jgi:DNA-binding transcriptional ArsR family regulator